MFYHSWVVRWRRFLPLLSWYLHRKRAVHVCIYSFIFHCCIPCIYLLRLVPAPEPTHANTMSDACASLLPKRLVSFPSVSYHKQASYKWIKWNKWFPLFRWIRCVRASFSFILFFEDLLPFFPHKKYFRHMQFALVTIENEIVLFDFEVLKLSPEWTPDFYHIRTIHDVSNRSSALAVIRSCIEFGNILYWHFSHINFNGHWTCILSSHKKQKCFRLLSAQDAILKEFAILILYHFCPLKFIESEMTDCWERRRERAMGHYFRFHDDDDDGGNDNNNNNYRLFLLIDKFVFNIATNEM